MALIVSELSNGEFDRYLARMPAKKSTESALKKAVDALTDAAIDKRLIADPLATSEAVGSLLKLLEEPVVKAAFAKLGPAYPEDTLVILAEAAEELRRLGIARRDREAAEDDAKIPASLVEEAMARRANLRKLTEYHFEEDPVIGPVLVDIRSGKGYRDLATDIVRYVDIILANAAALAGDRRYATADVPRATEVADEMFALLGRPKDAPADKQLRAVQTVVRRAYDRTLAAARLALFDHADELARFESLFGIVRAPRKPKKPTKSEA